MPRVIALLLSLAFTLPVHAEGFITRLLNKPVPGGVAVMSLGNGATPPHVRYQDKPALVIREDDQRWIAILGIPLTVKPGQQQVQVAARGLLHHGVDVGGQALGHQRVAVAG